MSLQEAFMTLVSHQAKEFWTYVLGSVLPDEKLAIGSELLVLLEGTDRRYLIGAYEEVIRDALGKYRVGHQCGIGLGGQTEIYIDSHHARILISTYSQLFA